jgi:flagellar protein FlgJ
MLDMSPQTMGLLGLNLLAAGDSNQPIDIMGLLGTAFLPQNKNQNQNQNQGTLGQASKQMSAVLPSLPESTATQGDYLTTLKQNAMRAYPDNPQMQQVAITQAIQESGLNPSKLATVSNNYFGIKSGKNPGVSVQTTEYTNGNPEQVNASFAQNGSIGDSFNQYKGLLGNQRYQSVMNANSPQDAFMALQKAGYATDPQYAQKLARVYSKYVQPLYTG